MNTDQKRKRIETIAWIAGAGVIGVIIAPFVFLAVKGIIGFIITGVITWTSIQFLPVFTMKIANWRLKALKYEASKNPIETLQNDYKARQEALSNFLQSIKDFATQVNIFGGKLVDFSKQYPEEAHLYRDQHAKMKQLLDLRFSKYEEVKAGLVAYALEIKKAEALWDMSKAAAEMNKAAGVDSEEFLQKISRETAIESVQKSLYGSLADLEISLREEMTDSLKIDNGSKQNYIEIDTKSQQKA